MRQFISQSEASYFPFCKERGSDRLYSEVPGKDEFEVLFGSQKEMAPDPEDRMR